MKASQVVLPNLSTDPWVWESRQLKQTLLMQLEQTYTEYWETHTTQMSKCPCVLHQSETAIIHLYTYYKASWQQCRAPWIYGKHLIQVGEDDHNYYDLRTIIFYKNGKDIGIVWRAHKQEDDGTEWRIRHGPHRQMCCTISHIWQHRHWNWCW